MGLGVGLVRELIAFEAWGLYDVLQHAAHVAVYILHLKTTCLHGLYDVGGLCAVAWHHQVVACRDFLLCGQVVAFTNPVGHHDALEAPLVAQHVGEQVFVALGVDPVNLVVRRHDGPRVALANHPFEPAQIDFAQGTLTDVLAHSGTVALL